ncbi:MAG: RluA family pseudouridine synthase [Myxococcales bacterium]|nr:RluA family pseudouridine synthase [Myxococcales bacterium]
MAVQLSVEPNPRVPLRVLHEDDHFLVVVKPAGVVTQPGVGHTHDTVLNAVFATHGKQLQNLGKARDFGLLHRLDRPTSGLLLVGLTPEGYDGLRAQFEGRTIGKTYLALVHGGPKPPQGTERSPIREVRRGGRKRAMLGAGRGAQEAVTRYATLARTKGISLLSCEPKTGRLHQIRAHMAHRGCAVVGDRDYGPRDALDKQFARTVKGALGLHAAELRFTHPVTRRSLSVRAPLPEAVLAFCAEVGLVVPRAWR